MKKTFILLLISAISQMLNAQIPSYIPKDSLVGWWPFNGNANDESGNGNNGTAYGTTLTSDRFGKANSAYSFDGTNIITANSIRFSTGLSISIWYNLSNNSLLNPSTGHPPTGSELIGQGTQHSPVLYSDFSVGISNYNNGTNQFAFEKSITSGNLYEMYYSNAAINISNWTNIVYSIKLNVAKVYLNGTLIDSFNLNSNFLNSGNFLSFGGRYVQNNLNPNCNFFTGIIDDIAIWGRALDSNEIKSIYNGTNSSANLNTDYSKSRIKYFPNPVKDILNIQGVQPNANYQITNTIGQTCLQGKFTEKLDVSALKSGVYFFKTETGTQRFVKE